MTDLQREMIEAYLPHERDPLLGEMEYYVKDMASRVRKVRVTDIFPGMNDKPTEYGVVDVKSGYRVDCGYNSPFRGFQKCELYDNKQDCRDMTHFAVDKWEELRRIQNGQD